MEINGLPLHVLVVHAAVVLTPMAAAAAFCYALVPRWRDWLRWPVVVATVVAVGVVWLAYLSGDAFLADSRFDGAQGEFADRLDRHAELGSLVRWVASAFGVVTLVATALHHRTGGVRWLLAVPVAALSVATLVLIVMTGDAGAQAVWGT